MNLKKGDRVKLAKHPASAPNTNYWFGTWNGKTVTWDGEIPDHWSPLDRYSNINFGLLLA